MSPTEIFESWALATKELVLKNEHHRHYCLVRPRDLGQSFFCNDLLQCAAGFGTFGT
jgi:hypothetical protein